MLPEDSSSSNSPDRPETPDRSRRPNTPGITIDGPSPTQRPPARPSASISNSTSSILTLSKLYQQKQQAGTLAVSNKSKKNVSSKLHKKALSSSSLTDYFNTSKSTSSESSTPKFGIESPGPKSPGPKLPTFQRMDSYDLEPSLSNTPNISQGLSSSKIHERRRLKKQQEEEEQEAADKFDTDIGNNKIDEALEEDYDEIAKKSYDTKKNNMNRKNVEFYNSDSESDIDMHSIPNVYHGSSSSSDQQKDEKDQDTQSESDKPKGLRGLLRRMTLSEGAEDLPERLRNKFDKHEEAEGDFFSKFVNLSGGGLIPGASKVEEKQKEPDEEEKIGDDIPLQNLNDPEQFAKEAKDILNAHSNSKVKTPTTDHSDESTLKDSINSYHDSFLAPNPDLYLRDEDDIFELNLDGSNTTDSSYIAPPERVRGGVLSALLKLYQNPEEASRSKLTLVNSEAGTPVHSPSEEKEEYFGKQNIGGLLKNFAGGKKKVHIDEDPKFKYMHHKKTNSLSDLSLKDKFLSPEFSSKKRNANSFTNLPSFAKTSRPKMKKSATNGLLKKQREQKETRITVHIADILQRQRFILRMSKALMLYGAPTHRLEEYLTMTARVLEIDAQFIYLPGVMIVSFGDATTRTSEVQLVRCAQGLNLYKLHRVHRIYKQVIHDLIGVEEASNSLDELLAKKPQFSPMLCVLIYAFSSAMVTPFAFGGGWVNLPVSFGIGGCVGFLQFYISPRSNLYSNVFEVTASIVVAFIGRALGSISGANICFSAVVQGSLALILPGYIILCGSLELQSRNLVAGSVRMFYAIIYSLFLSFGITLGAALYGWIDKNATSETTCATSINPWWRFLFVPMFTLGLGLINQAKWFQLPIMLFISCSGYVVNYFAAKHFSDSTEFTAALGAFVIGLLGNLYSRLWKGLAVSAMLPAIFVQVPSGIASQSSLLAGVESANKIVSNSTSSTTSNSNSLSFGITMVEVAIGISVGLFASTIAVYPFGKKSTSIFTL